MRHLLLKELLQAQNEGGMGNKIGQDYIEEPGMNDMVEVMRHAHNHSLLKGVWDPYNPGQAAAPPSVSAPPPPAGPPSSSSSSSAIAEVHPTIPGKLRVLTASVVGVAAGEKFPVKLPHCIHQVRIPFPSEPCTYISFKFGDGCPQCRKASSG